MVGGSLMSIFSQDLNAPKEAVMHGGVVAGGEHYYYFRLARNPTKTASPVAFRRRSYFCVFLFIYLSLSLSLSLSLCMYVSLFLSLFLIFPPTTDSMSGCFCTVCVFLVSFYDECCCFCCLTAPVYGVRVIFYAKDGGGLGRVRLCDKNINDDV